MGFEEFDLSPREAAELLGVNEETVRRWIKNKKLRAWRQPGGRFRISTADCRALLPAADPAVAS